MNIPTTHNELHTQLVQARRESRYFGLLEAANFVYDLGNRDVARRLQELAERVKNEEVK